MSTGYDKVASVIGDEMDKAWKNIMERLAQNGPSAFAGNANITNTDLQDFFVNLGGAHLGIQFSCVNPKGEQKIFSAYQITPTFGPMPAATVGGSISIGVNIGF